MPVAVDAHRCLVQVAEHDPLGVRPRVGRVTRVDGVAEPDRNRGGASGDVAGRQETIRFGRGTHTFAAGGNCAAPRVGTGGHKASQGEERYMLRWHEGTIHYTISPWDSHAVSS